MVVPRCVADGVVVLVGLWLSGCAGVMRVDSQVQAHAIWPDALGSAAAGELTRPQTYEFERLPSQQTAIDPLNELPSQTELEQWTQAALLPLGWWRPDSVADVASVQPRWRVHVTGHQQRFARAPWDDPPERWVLRTGIGLGLSHAGGGGWHGTLRTELPYFVRHLSIVVRDSAQGHVVYETRALHDGRWPSRPELWQAMIQAALHGFPHPPSVVQRIDIDIPR